MWEAPVLLRFLKKLLVLRSIVKLVIEKGCSVVKQEQLIISIGFHLGDPFHGDDGLLLEVGFHGM